MSLDRNWRDSMREAANRLAQVGMDNAPREARLLLALAMGVEPVDVIGRESDAVEPVALAAYQAMIQRRLAREPLSRIRGWREFYGRRFIVTPDVLDPRPETELLVEHGLKRLARDGRVLDLGVGSGCILVSVLGEREDASGVGLDISPAALAVAQRNAHNHGVGARASFLEADWLDDPGGRFDLALSNPPYIAQSEMAELAEDVRGFDPIIALTPGGDGLRPYRAILSAMPAWLKPGGWIGFEFGASQSAQVADLMAAADLEAIAILADLAGIARAAFGRRPVHGA